jgi:hypothetical protein
VLRLDWYTDDHIAERADLRDEPRRVGDVARHRDAACLTARYAGDGQHAALWVEVDLGERAHLHEGDDDRADVICLDLHGRREFAVALAELSAGCKAKRQLGAKLHSERVDQGW